MNDLLKTFANNGVNVVCCFGMLIILCTIFCRYVDLHKPHRSDDAGAASFILCVLYWIVIIKWGWS